MARRTLAVWAALALGACALFVSRASAGTLPTPAPARVVASPTPLAGAVRDKYPQTASVIGEGLLAFPPRPSVATPRTVVYLHGVHGLARNGCPVFRSGASALGWLVCPEPPKRDGVGFSWDERSSINDDVVRSAEEEAARAGAGAPAVLVGFSQGAYVALDALSRHPGKYRGAVLLGAEMEPDVRDLGGVARLVLGAGALDGAFASMQRAATKLRAQGVDVRFVSLGHVGHTYAAEDPEARRALEEALIWAGEA